MTIQQLPVYTGEIPTLGQGQSEFNTNVSDKLAYDSLLIPAQNIYANEANALAAEVEANASIAEDAVAEIGVPSLGLPVIASAGQTVFQVGKDLKLVYVNKGGEILQTPTQFTYDILTGDVTLVTPAVAGESYQFGYNSLPSSTLPDLFIATIDKTYSEGDVDHPSSGFRLEPKDSQGNNYNILGNVSLEINGVPQYSTGTEPNFTVTDSKFIDLIGFEFRATNKINLKFNAYQYSEGDKNTDITSVVLSDLSSIASFDSSIYLNLKKITTLQHTSNGIGGASYIKVSSGTPDAFGFVVQDASSQLWMIDTKTTGVLFFEQLGALDKDLGGSDIGPAVQKAMQVQSVSGCALNHEASGEFLFETSAGPMMGGENSTKIEINKPSVIWNGYSSSEVFIMLEAPTSAAEGLRVSGLTLIPSLQKAATVPNPRLDPEGYKNATSWGVDWSRCRNGSHLSRIRFVAGGNGIALTDCFYSSMSDIDLRGIESDGVGLLEYALTNSTQVNGMNHRNIKLHNGENNLLCVCADGVAVDANVYDNVYLENSSGVAGYFKGWKGTTLIAPYLENNAPIVASNGTTDLFAVDSSITIIGGLINSPQSGAADTFAVAHEGEGFIKLDGGIRLRKGNRTTFARGNIIWGNCEGMDFTIPGSRSQLSSMRAGNEQLIEAKRDTKYDSQTTIPLAMSLDGDDQLRVLWLVDLNTTQFRESWMFDVDITSTRHGATNQGCVTLRCTVKKEGAAYTLNTAVYGEVKNLASSFGTYSADISSGEVLIRFSPSTNTADTRAVLKPILCGSNFRVSEIKEGY